MPNTETFQIQTNVLELWHMHDIHPLYKFVLKKFDDVCELVRVCPVNAISSATNTDF